MTPAEQRERELARKTIAPLGSPFEAKVVGVSFSDAYPDNLYALDATRQEMSIDLEPLPAILVREPGNPSDPNAIQVHVPALGDKWGFIGFLTRPIVARLAPEMDAGVQWGAEVINVLIHSDHLGNPGISIRCYRVVDELSQEAQRLGLE